MKNGKYKTNNIDFSKYALKHFNPNLWDEYYYGKYGCGPSALGLLCKINPYHLYIKNPLKKHYSDQYMVDTLRKVGKYKVFTITKADVTSNEVYLEEKIKNNHLVLVSQLMLKGQGSWSVFWNGLQFHNFRISKIEPLDSINFPLLSCYLLYREDLA